MECFVLAGLMHIKANGRHPLQNPLIPFTISVRAANRTRHT